MVESAKAALLIRCLKMELWITCEPKMINSRLANMGQTVYILSMHGGQIN